MALILTNLKGTQETAFGIGDGTLDASGLSTARTLTLPDASGTLALQGAITTSGLTIASGRLAGRTTAGTGALEEISIGSGLTLASGSLSANVTSVAGRTGAVTLTDADISGLGTLATLNSVDLTSNVTGILPSANGGTGNGFTKFSGPASSEKTFALPNASATILTTDATVTVPQGGTGATTLTGYVVGNGTSAFTASATIPAADVSGLVQGVAWSVIISPTTMSIGNAYLVDAGAGTVTVTLPASLTVGDVVVVSVLDGDVIVDLNGHSVSGAGGTVTDPDTLSLANGETAYMVANSSSEMRLV